MVHPLQVKAAEWSVAIEEIRKTATSLIGFGGERDGTRVVLKLVTNADDELNSGKVLEAFGGDGVVRVLEFDVGAVLLERLEPGEQLVNVVRRGDDDQATSILADVIEKLANHSPPVECPSVADWGRGFDRYIESSDKVIPDNLVREAQEVFDRLASSQRNPMLLHGDLQHFNVLFDKNRGWVAIDPKGVVGELEYEVGALLRNPVDQPELFTNTATIERRLKILTTRLPLDYSRTLSWSFAQAVLSAIWDVQDGYPVGPQHQCVLLAHTLREML